MSASHRGSQRWTGSEEAPVHSQNTGNQVLRFCIELYPLHQSPKLVEVHLNALYNNLER